MTGLGTFLLDVAPNGGWICACAADGEPRRAPGSFRAAVDTPWGAPHPSHPDAFVVHFPGSGTKRDLSFNTTDPWKQLPSGGWILPQLDEALAIVGWFRFTPRTEATP